MIQKRNNDTIFHHSDWQRQKQMVMSYVGYRKTGFIIHCYWYKLVCHSDRQSGNVYKKFKTCILFDSAIRPLNVYLKEIIR